MSGAAPSGPALIWCPFPGEAEAREAAVILLDERLVACVNIVPGMLSLFTWNGERGEERETGALFKTDGALLDAAIARIEVLHPYDTPAITGWRVSAASSATSRWLAGLLDGRTGG